MLRHNYWHGIILLVVQMKYKVGQIIYGQIVGITNYGAFVKIDDEYTGLLHISQISNGFVSEIEKYVQIGELRYMKILEIDYQKKQVKLSLKDIDHKMYSQNNQSGKIIETPSGFKTLRRKLNYWIKEYLKNEKKVISTKKIKKFY